VRLIKEEYPLKVACRYPDAESRKEIEFYEAISFDGPTSSIIMGLTLPDTPLEEFLPTEELGPLLSLCRAQAIPMLELHQYKVAHSQQVDEIKLMMGVVRDSGSEISRLPLSALSTPLPTTNGKEGLFAESGFLHYLAAELRGPINHIFAANEKQIELSRAAGHPEMTDITTSLHGAARQVRRIVRNLSNYASLVHPEVKPRVGAFALQQLLKDLYSTTLESAAAVGVRPKLEENTRNLSVGGDQATTLKMLERLVNHSLSFCEPGRQLIIRSDDDPDEVEAGFVRIEIEDTGENARDINPATLLDKSALPTLQHPRLKRGGGVLYQLMHLYLEKAGGKFRLARGREGGFAARVILPLVSRAELARQKAREGTKSDV
jgi:K+-sensing histidine kinase KdpD